MPYFYLQVDRLDAQTLMPAYFLICADADTLDERIAARLQWYRDQGFQMVHYPDRPTFKTARRAADGVKLEMLIIQRDTPLATCCNLGEDDDASPAIH